MSHVVTFEKYLNIIQPKIMANATITTKIRKYKQKEKEEMMSKLVAKTLIVVDSIEK